MRNRLIMIALLAAVVVPGAFAKSGSMIPCGPDFCPPPCDVGHVGLDHCPK